MMRWETVLVGGEDRIFCTLGVVPKDAQNNFLNEKLA